MIKNIKFSIIVAVDKNNGIGKNGDLPWNFPKDLEFFKNKTTSTIDKSKKNVVIMGKNTWTSIPDKYKPLSGRKNIVLSRSQLNLPDGVDVAGSLENALSMANYLNNIENIFIIGGGSVYKQAINMKNCEQLYITKIMDEFDCDTFFPEYINNFKHSNEISEFDNNTELKFCTFVRRR